MRIAVVHSYYTSLQPSGENVVVDAQIDAMRSRGVEVTEISLNTDVLRQQKLYKVRAAVDVATGHGRSPLEELSRLQPDVVHVHNLFPNWGTRWLNRWDGPIVSTVHNFRPMCAAGTLYRDGQRCTACVEGSSFNAVKHACYRSSHLASVPLAIRNRHGLRGDVLMQRANRVIALSARSKSSYIEAGLEEQKIALVPNFVDDIGFMSSAPLGKKWVFVGRLTQEKGVLELLDMWPSDHELKIYGSGPLLRKVEDISARRPEVDYVGQAERSSIPALLAGSRGLIFPSRCAEGGIAQTYVEALAAGRPIVALEGNSVADDVLESGTGMVYGANRSIQTALQLVENDRNGFASTARQRFEAHFSRNAWMESILKVYKEAMGTRSVERVDPS